MRSVSITEEEFLQTYRPIRNLFTEYAPFDWGQGYGTMFETYGMELGFVRSHPTSHIWTYICGDEGGCISSGYHLVNRLGYFITVNPLEIGLTADVLLDNS